MKFKISHPGFIISILSFFLFLPGSHISAQSSFTGNGSNSLVGAYTINKTLPTGGTNFNSFRDFSDALTATGVTGNVVATVAAILILPFSGRVFRNSPDSTGTVHISCATMEFRGCLVLQSAQPAATHIYKPLLV